MQKLRFVKSSRLLIAVTLAWGGGIVLLYQAYVRPSLASQARRTERENAAQWLRQANCSLRVRRQMMQQFCAHLAGDAGLAQYLRSRDEKLLQARLSRQCLERHCIHKLLLCDGKRRVVSAWKRGQGGRFVQDEDFRAGEELAALSFFRLRPVAPNVSGIGNTPGGLLMFTRAAVGLEAGRQPLGYVVGVRPVDDTLFSDMSALIGLKVTLQRGLDLPRGKALTGFGHVVWRESPNFLRAGQVFRDSFSSPVGYLLVRGEAKAPYQHVRLVGRALTIMLLWAIGFSGLMLLVIHMVISRPTSVLVSRIEQLRRGQQVADLSANLRGEALILARRFEDILERAEKLSRTDALTELSNRRSFQQVFAQEFRRARRYSRPLSLAIMDVDFFKAANDALGHQVGDAVLRTFAQVIQQEVRAPDVVSRLGGDEFAILMPETSVNDAVSVAERVRARLAAKVVGRGDLKMSLTTSIGVADVNVPGADTPEYFYDLADQALYAAKRRGRNRVVRADDLDPQAAEDTAQGEPRSRVNQLSRRVARLDARFKRLFVDAIGGLISALEARDVHTANHSAKVRWYAVRLARQMALPEPTIEHVARAAMLHDIGKIGLPDSVLMKDGPLSDEEWDLLKRHPVISCRIVEGMAFLDQEIPTVRHHHERYDGGGYPEGLAGSAIPLPARILAVADAFDAMTSSRVFRRGKPVQAAVEELNRGSGTQFDPAVVEAFLEVLSKEHITDETIHGALSQSA